ncbi:MAG: hypothetical protein ABSA67_17170 [Candidatus Brocadiia bacterium]|jgi:hypothetical protein
MIPSDHFVRFYNEVFKALEARGHECLVAYWRELGRLQSVELADRFRAGGLKAALEYWKRIVIEENCESSMVDHGDYFEFHMIRCPSLSKVLDNDARPCEFYCDHCMGWVEPVMKASGLYAVMDMESRTEPHCTFRVFSDKAKAMEFERKARLLSKPYDAAAAPAGESGFAKRRKS